MPLMKFSLENLPELDFGKIPAVFRNEMRRVVADCKERPLDDKPRTVAIKFSVTPKAESGGSGVICDHVYVAVDVESKVPPQKSQVYDMLVQADDNLLFRPTVPEDPDQLEIDEGRTERSAAERKKKE